MEGQTIRYWEVREWVLNILAPWIFLYEAFPEVTYTELAHIWYRNCRINRLSLNNRLVISHGNVEVVLSSSEYDQTPPTLFFFSNTVTLNPSSLKFFKNASPLGPVFSWSASFIWLQTLSIRGRIFDWWALGWEDKGSTADVRCKRRPHLPAPITAILGFSIC